MPVTTSEVQKGERPAFAVEVTNNLSSWYYSGGELDYCKMGMVFAVNPTVHSQLNTNFVDTGRTKLIPHIYNKRLKHQSMRFRQACLKVERRRQKMLKVSRLHRQLPPLQFRLRPYPSQQLPPPPPDREEI